MPRWRECAKGTTAFAGAVSAGDTAAALDADDELHAIPVSILGNRSIESVLDQFGPVVRRAERDRFAEDGQAAIERHERLIQLLASGDAERASELTFEIWHSLPAERTTSRADDPRRVSSNRPRPARP
jgi:DNA-binding GntR family transcriptional regulator